MQESWVQSLGWEDPVEKGMAIHFSILAWRISWTEEPGGLQSIGLQSQTWLKQLSMHTCMSSYVNNCRNVLSGLCIFHLSPSNPSLSPFGTFSQMQILLYICSTLMIKAKLLIHSFIHTNFWHLFLYQMLCWVLNSKAFQDHISSLFHLPVPPGQVLTEQWTLLECRMFFHTSKLLHILVLQY